MTDVVGEWVERNSRRGAFYHREIQGFDDMLIRPIEGIGWSCEPFEGGERHFATRAEAEAHAFQNAIAYVTKFRDECQAVIDELQQKAPRSTESGATS